MAESTRRNVELLVHVAAPSTGRDDARYRAFAAAFLSFEPCHRVDIAGCPGTNTDIDGEVGSQLQDELLISTQERPEEDSYKPIEEEDECGSTQYSTQYSVENDPFDSSFEMGSPCDNRALSYRQNVGRPLFPRSMASPELSFRSVMDNADSPVFRGLDYEKIMPEPGNDVQSTSQESHASGSWRPPPSTVADSQEEYQPVKLIPSSPTRILELYLGHFNTPADPSSSAPRRSGRIAAMKASSSLPSSAPPSQPIPSSAPEVEQLPMAVSEDNNSDPHDWSLPISLPTSTDSAQPDMESEPADFPLPTVLVPRSDFDPIPSSPKQPDLVPRTSSTEIVPKTSSCSVAQGRSMSEQPSASHATSSQSHTSTEAIRPATAPAGHVGTIQRPFLTTDGRSTVNGLLAYKRRHSIAASQVDADPSVSVEEPEHDPDQSSGCREQPNKRQRIDSHGLEGKEPSTRPSTLNSTPPLLNSVDTNLHPLEIRAPFPPTGAEDITPESLVTKTLLKLEQDKKLRGMFKPQQQTRELRPLERGYWLVNWHAWTPELRERCWGFLSATVGQGGAGFGVWCTRDDDFRKIRVYCWGKIVEHIYLLLFIASEGKIRRTGGACWIDGEGTAVVTMPS